MSSGQPDRGGRAEELLREYFLTAGFYVVRGVPVTYQGYDITDIDLWLYIRPSPLSRERINVDAKNKATPKALERVLWAKGLQAILGLEQCIVATTDKRPEVKQYGHRHGVLVLDGSFLGRLAQKKQGTPDVRLVEEELIALLGSGEDDRLLGNWKRRYSAARGRLLTHLEFDGCNLWLEDIRYFAEQAASSARYQAACRLAYLTTSFFLIGLDYSMRKLAFEEPDVRKRAMEEGFRYGTGGPGRTAETLSMAARLIETYTPEAKALGNKLRAEVQRDLASMPSEILSEFFSRQDVVKELFGAAKSFESQAYARNFVSPGNLDSASQAILGVILDFHNIDRRTVLR